MTPLEIDTKLAALYHEHYRLQSRQTSIEISLKQQAKAKFYYRGRQRVTDMTTDEAIEIVTSEIAKLEAHRQAHEGEDGLWIGYVGKMMPYEQSSAEHSLEGYHANVAAIKANDDAIDELQSLYTGWSRFFLVTSSQGHIHSSMHCSTCRPTTTYGWLPELSGKDEKDAVETCGPALCTVCFPSAPIDWTSAKVSKRDAEKAAA